MNRKTLTTLAEILGLAVVAACAFFQWDWEAAGFVVGIALIAVGVTQA